MEFMNDLTGGGMPSVPPPLPGAEQAMSPMDRLRAAFAAFQQQQGGGAPAPEDTAIPQNAQPTAGPVPPIAGGSGVPLPRPDPRINIPLPRPDPRAPGMEGMAPPPMPPGGEVTPSGGSAGGLAGALGLTPDTMRMLSRSLAGGLSKVKSSPFAMESFSQGAGGAMTGGNKYEDDEHKRKVGALDQALKARGQEQTADYRNRSLDETSRYHDGVLNRDNVTPVGQTADGKMIYLNRADGTETIGGVIGTSKGGSGAGRNSVFEQKRAAWLAANPGDEQGALGYASGQKKPGAVDINRMASAAARGDLAADPMMQRKSQAEKDKFLNDRIEFWRQKHMEGSTTAPMPGRPVPPRGPAAERPDLMTPGDGGKPLNVTAPPRPAHVPRGSSYSPSRNQWRTPDGQILDGDEPA